MIRQICCCDTAVLQILNGTLGVWCKDIKWDSLVHGGAEILNGTLGAEIVKGDKLCGHALTSNPCTN